MLDQQYVDQFVKQQVNPILESLMLEILTKKPNKQEIFDFMIVFLQSQKENQIKEKIEILNDFSDNKSDNSSIKENIDSQTFYIEIKQDQKIRRQSYNKNNCYNQDIQEDFKYQKVEKSLEDTENIKNQIKNIFIFNALIESELDQIVDSFDIQNFDPQQKIIQQGDQKADYFYIVKQGQLACYKSEQQQNQNFLKIYNRDDYFGELALIQNSPRATTIISITNCTLYTLDRVTFQNVMVKTIKQKRLRLENILKNIDILQTINQKELQQVIDNVKYQTYLNNEEGDCGDSFYFILQGKAIATKKQENGQNDEVVYQYKEGEYFGEIALLKDQPRQASIIAQGTLVVGNINRQTFNRVVGPLENILKRNYSRYEKFIY